MLIISYAIAMRCKDKRYTSKCTLEEAGTGRKWMEPIAHNVGMADNGESTETQRAITAQKCKLTKCSVSLKGAFSFVKQCIQLYSRVMIS